MSKSTRPCSVNECGSTVHGHGYCVKHYKRWKKHGDPNYKAESDCVTCGERFLLGTRGVPSPICPVCREISRRSAMYKSAQKESADRFERDRRFATCGHCLTSFQRDNRDTKSYLCESCRPSERLRKAREWYERNPEARALTPRKRAQAKAYKHRRRVIYRDARSDKFLASEIYERDAWECQICSIKIDPAVKFPARDSASLDHIIPIALGGTHTLDNVQLACMGCNWSKGARMSA